MLRTLVAQLQQPNAAIQFKLAQGGWLRPPEETNDAI